MAHEVATKHPDFIWREQPTPMSCGLCAIVSLGFAQHFDFNNERIDPAFVVKLQGSLLLEHIKVKVRSLAEQIAAVSLTL